MLLPSLAISSDHEASTKVQIQFCGFKFCESNGTDIQEEVSLTIMQCLVCQAYFEGEDREGNVFCKKYGQVGTLPKITVTWATYRPKDDSDPSAGSTFSADVLVKINEVDKKDTIRLHLPNLRYEEMAKFVRTSENDFESGYKMRFQRTFR